MRPGLIVAAAIVAVAEWLATAPQAHADYWTKIFTAMTCQRAMEVVPTGSPGLLAGPSLWLIDLLGNGFARLDPLLASLNIPLPNLQQRKSALALELRLFSIGGCFLGLDAPFSLYGSVVWVSAVDQVEGLRPLPVPTVVAAVEKWLHASP